MVYSVAKFCQLHGVSKTTFYQLLRERKAPAVFRIGRRTLISAEAAADWRRSLESATAQEPATKNGGSPMDKSVTGMLSQFSKSTLETLGFYEMPSAGLALLARGVPLGMLPACSMYVHDLEDEDQQEAHLEEIVRDCFDAARLRGRPPVISEIQEEAWKRFGPVEYEELLAFIRYLGGKITGDYFEIEDRCRGDDPCPRLIPHVRRAIRYYLLGRLVGRALQS